MLRNVGLRIAGVATLGLLIGSVLSQEAPKKKAAKPLTLDRGVLESLPSAGDAPKVDKDHPPEKPPEAGWTCYNHFAVNYASGNRMPNTATAISVYAHDISWWYAAAAGHTASPEGNGADAGSDFQYPGAKQFGIVLHQDGRVWQIRGTAAGNATAITGLSNTKPFHIAVNDTKGNYGDNWGSFKICVRVDAK